ncbi:unnamed protein product [Larinioides sclopetarius]|uniref:Speckle-type POZ protein n=1 Tax=Larinioides sclopetarius TaxID=280406 RepID=A0AAV2BZR6_9ARAC
MRDGRVEYTFLWFIENYIYCGHKNGEELLSPHFTADELEGTSWRISVYPKGRTEEDKGYISLYLRRSLLDDEPENVSLNYELSFFAADGLPFCLKASKETFICDNAAGWPKFVKLEDVAQKILTVRCRIWRGEGKIHKVAPICARTQVAVENISFMHVVGNFSALDPNKKNTIKIQSHSRKEWALFSSLYFKHDSCREGEIIVKITPFNSPHAFCKLKISLLDANGNLIVCGENDNRFDAEGKDVQQVTLPLTRQDILNIKSEYLPDDKLSLLCECSFPTGLELEKIEVTQHELLGGRGLYRPRRKMRGRGFRRRYLAEASAYPSVSEGVKAHYISLTNVELKTKTKSFPAHRSVLCAASPVFKIRISMTEKDTDYIQVYDLEDDIVEQLLLFLYSDNIENLEWNTATQLYYAAKRYQIGKLKEICSSFLVKNLTTTNAGELLVLADTHSDCDLKKSVEDFITEYEEQVFSSKEWEMFIEISPELAAKTMHLKYKRGSGDYNSSEGRY